MYLVVLGVSVPGSLRDSGVLYVVVICCYLLAVAVPSNSKLISSLTSTGICSLLVERNWLNL